MKKRTIVLGMVGMLVIGSVACSNNSDNVDMSNTTVKEESSLKDYEILGNLTLSDDGQGTYYIKGTLKNNSYDKDYVQIDFTLYDKDGNNVGTAFTNMNNLKQGGTWKFEAIALSTTGEVASFELDEITGF